MQVQIVPTACTQKDIYVRGMEPIVQMRFMCRFVSYVKKGVLQIPKRGKQAYDQTRNKDN